MRKFMPAAVAVATFGLMAGGSAVAGTEDFNSYTVTATISQSTTTVPGAKTFANSATFAGYSGFAATPVATISGGLLNPGGSTNPGSGFDNTIANYVSAVGGIDETIQFNSDQKYFGMLWGSVDATNTISFYDNNTLLESFTGQSLSSSAVTLLGYPANGSFVDFTADNELFYFNKVVLSAAQSLPFETANFAAAGVPEPATWAMLILGMGAMGAVVRRRRGGLVAA